MTKRIRLGLIAILSAMLVLCTGLFIGQTVGKSEELPPVLTNYAKNLSFDDNVHVLYAVEVDNLKDGDELGMLVWTSAPESYVYGTQDAVLDYEIRTVEGSAQPMPVFTYAISAKQMTDTLYTVAFVKRGDTYYYAEPRKYSALEYAYNKLGKTEAEPTTDEELKELLNSMLEYGGAAQKYFDYKEDALANQAHAYVRTDHATFADGYDYVIGKVGSKVEIYLEEGYVLAENHADYISVEDGRYFVTIPADKIIDTTSIVREGLKYTLLGDGTYSVAIGTCREKDIVIPETYNGKAVTVIANRGFIGSDITSVVLPQTITKIDYEAFYNCQSLTSINIPSSVVYINDHAFSWCKSLTITADFESAPETWSSTWNYSNCPVIWKLAQPEYTEGLEFTLINNDTEYAVSDYTGSSTEVIIPSTYNGKTVTSIGYEAFSWCYSLTSIEIPSSVTSIGECAFELCYSLTSVVIPSSVTSIGSSAFYNCSSLTSIEIPSSVTSIGDSAFRDCSSLTSIVIPNSVTSIGEYAFSGCNNLTTVTFGEDSQLECINYNAFSSCTSLTSIEIPSSVTSIGDWAFSDCSKLKTVTFGENSQLQSIGEDVFGFCRSLISIEIPESVTSIGDSAFGGCISLTSIEIPSSVTSIGEYAFSGCTSLTSIEIPSSVTSIGNSAFYYCSKLTTVTFDKNSQLQTIGDEAFAYCTSLTSIEIPSSVTSIGSSAFEYCSNLTIYCEAQSQPETWSSTWNRLNRPVVWGFDNFQTLKSLGEQYSEDILRQAQINAGTMVGNYEIVVLDAYNTVQNIQNYTFNNIDFNKVIGGLFVKFDVTNGTDQVLFTIYYNFGLQFIEEQTQDLSVTYDGVEFWYLEVVEQDPTVLFEYSIVSGEEQLTQEQASLIYKNAAKAIWQMLGKEDPTEQQSGPALMSIRIPDRTQKEESESTKEGFINNLNVMTLYVNFIGDLYANPNFVYTDKLVTFVANANMYGEYVTHTMSVYTQVDRANQKIYAEYYLTDPSMGELYMLMDIGYDFDNNVATSFRLIYYSVYGMGGETYRMLNDQIYTAEGDCYLNANYEDYATEMQEFELDFANRKENGVILSTTFDLEYQTLIDLSEQLQG